MPTPTSTWDTTFAPTGTAPDASARERAALMDARLADPDTARHAAADLAHRLHAWSPACEYPGPLPIFTEWLLIGPLFLFGAIVTTFGVSGLRGHSRFGTAEGVLVIGITLLTAAVYRLSARRRITVPLARFRKSRCPDCGYDLSKSPTLPPPFDPATLGSHPGPALCPECAAPWPLVPPPPHFAP